MLKLSDAVATPSGSRPSNVTVPRCRPPGGTVVDHRLRKLSARSVVPSTAVSTQLPNSGSDTGLRPPLRTTSSARVKWAVCSTFSTRRMRVPARADTGWTRRSTPDSLPVQ